MNTHLVRQKLKDQTQVLIFVQMIGNMLSRQSSLSSSEHAALTVIDEGGWAEPQLRTAFSRGVHDAEVVDAGPQHGAVSRTQLGDAAEQHLHPLTSKPVRHQQRQEPRQKRTEEAQQRTLTSDSLSWRNV